MPTHPRSHRAINLALHSLFHAGVLQHLAQHTTVTAADNQNLSKNNREAQEQIDKMRQCGGGGDMVSPELVTEVG